MMKKFMTLMLIAAVAGAPVVNAVGDRAKRTAQRVQDRKETKAAKKAAANKPSLFDSVRAKVAAFGVSLHANKGKLMAAALVLAAAAATNSMHGEAPCDPHGHFSETIMCDDALHCALRIVCEKLCLDGSMLSRTSLVMTGVNTTTAYAQYMAEWLACQS